MFSSTRQAPIHITINLCLFDSRKGNLRALNPAAVTPEMSPHALLADHLQMSCLGPIADWAVPSVRNNSATKIQQTLVVTAQETAFTHSNKFPDLVEFSIIRFLTL